jgi:hypothetical protein
MRSVALKLSTPPQPNCSAVPPGRSGCGRKRSDPHHLRQVQPRALGRKASDEFAVPLCRSHHRAVHRASNEQRWWQTTGIDPLKIARKLCKHTRVNEGQIRLIGWHKTPTRSGSSKPPVIRTRLRSRRPACLWIFRDMAGYASIQQNMVILHQTWRFGSRVQGKVKVE